MIFDEKECGLTALHRFECFWTSWDDFEKEYVQIKRVNQSLALFASSKDIKSQDLADQLGYYDSAHFINEFKKYTGKTPKSLKNSLFEMKNSEFIDEFKQYISPEHLLHYTSIFRKNS